MSRPTFLKRPDCSFAGGLRRPLTLCVNLSDPCQCHNGTICSRPTQSGGAWLARQSRQICCELPAQRASEPLTLCDGCRSGSWSPLGNSRWSRSCRSAVTDGLEVQPIPRDRWRFPVCTGRHGRRSRRMRRVRGNQWVAAYSSPPATGRSPCSLPSVRPVSAGRRSARARGRSSPGGRRATSHRVGRCVVRSPDSGPADSSPHAQARNCRARNAQPYAREACSDPNPRVGR
jgi:hypothetical protein